MSAVSNSNAFPVYLRPSAAADYCGLSVSTLNELRLTGDGPAYSKLARAIIYSREVLDQWISSRTRRSTSERVFAERGPRCRAV